MRTLVLAAVGFCLLTTACRVHVNLGFARDCRGRDLVVTGITPDGIGGDLIGLRNNSSTTCALRRFPTKLTGTSDAGSGEIPIIGHMKSPLVPKAGNVKARAIGRVVVGPVMQCPPTATGHALKHYHELRLFVPGGGDVKLTDVTMDITCGARVTQVGVAR
jgi:hypothetical protein